MELAVLRQNGSQRPLALALVLVALIPGLPPLPAQELTPTKPSLDRPLWDNPMADWGPNYTNWVEVSVGNFFVDGSKAAFMQRQQVPATAFGGIEGLHLEQPVGTNALVQLDGRGIFDNHDYELSLDYRRPGLGYVRGGYREFRTWYDRSGGFYPPTGLWLTPFDQEVAIDRGDAWFEAGLRLPDLPELTFRYSHRFRSGDKDSTSWGDVNVGGTAGTRSIVPSFLRIDEKSDSFQLDLKHTLDKTDFGVGLRYELIEQANERNILRQPGQPAERAVTQKDGVDTDLLNAHAFSATRFSDKVLLTSGWSYTTLDTDLDGSRIYGSGFEAVYDPLFARRQQFDEGFFNLDGGSVLHQYLFNLNLLVTPWEHFSLLPAVRFEEEDEKGNSRFVSTTVGPAPGLASTSEPLQERNSRDFLDVAESLEARYTGLTNWLLYARGEWTEDTGNLRENEIAMGTNSPLQNTDSERFTQKYILGLNWYPLRRLNLAAQYYHKMRDVDYNPKIGDRTAYPGFLQDQNFDLDDVNFRITLRPMNGLTLVTRYDFQLASIDTTGGNGTNGLPLGQVQSAETTTHIIGQSVSWAPMARLYLQATFNFVLDETDTPAQDLTGGAANLVLRSENNYWNASALVGFALNDKTDLQLQYFYYRANDYRDNSAFSQPYGAGAEENGVTATLIRQLTHSLRWTLKYGFFTNHDQTYGGHKDYNAHLVYSSLQYRF